MNLGDKLKRLREQNDLSPEQLAEKIEVSDELILSWESSETFPELDKLLWLSQLFGVPTDYLLSERETHVQSDNVPLAYEKEIPNDKYGVRFSLGIVLITLGSLSLLIFLILWAFNPVVDSQNDQQYSGFQGYLLAFPGAKQLFIISLLVIITGAVLLTYKQLQAFAKIHRAIPKTVLMKIGFAAVLIGAAGLVIIMIVSQYIFSALFTVSAQPIKETILKNYSFGNILLICALLLGIIIIVIEHVRFLYAKRMKMRSEE